MRTLDRLIVWVVGACVLSAALAAVFISSQQLERLGADDAGDRLATEVAAELHGGEHPDAAPSHDLATSLEPFYVVYDDHGRPISGTGYLHGALATVPRGVLEAAAIAPNRVTWQPQPGLRFATVSIRSGADTVLAGESLTPTEERIDRLESLLLLGWGACMVALAVGAGAHLLIARRLDAAPS